MFSVLCLFLLCTLSLVIGYTGLNVFRDEIGDFWEERVPGFLLILIGVLLLLFSFFLLLTL